MRNLLAAIPESHHVHADRLLEDGRGNLLGSKAAICRDTSVVDQDVDSPEALASLLDHRSDRVGIGHVAGQRQRDCASRREIGGEELEPFDAPGREHDLRAGSRQRSGEGLAQARRGAGHDGRLAGQWLLRHDSSVRHCAREGSRYLSSHGSGSLVHPFARTDLCCRHAGRSSGVSRSPRAGSGSLVVPRRRTPSGRVVFAKRGVEE